MTAICAPGGAPIIGIVGWKNSGKTTLVVRLVEEFTRRGLRVATIKHAHHGFEIDTAETDSARHRRAGAGQVAIVSSKRWALIAELKDAPEPALDDIIAHLAPCDLIIVEGYKWAPIPKIESRRSGAAHEKPLAPDDAHVIAIATDGATRPDAAPPMFALDDISGMANFITTRLRIAGAAV